MERHKKILVVGLSMLMFGAIGYGFFFAFLKPTGAFEVVSATPAPGDSYVNWKPTASSATFDANPRPPRLPVRTGTSIVAQDSVVEDYPLSSFQAMKRAKLNHVVINFGWNKLEKTKGTYDATYLRKLDTVIQRATDSGLYVIIRSHKWVFQADAHTPIGYQAWNRDYADCIGFPAWIPVFGFWDDANGCHDAYIRMMQMLATRYRTNLNVVGFALLSEPGNDLANYWDDAIRDKVLHVLFEPTRLWQRTIDAIHAVHPDSIVIFEGHAGRWFTYADGGMVERPDATNIYAGQSVYSDDDAFADNHALVTHTWQIPYVLTEIGVEPEYLSPGSLEWLDRTLRYCQQHNVGWSHWNWGGIATSVRAIITRYAGG